MESRKEITDFVTTKKTEKSGIYELVKYTISLFAEMQINEIPVARFCQEIKAQAKFDLFDKSVCLCVTEKLSKSIIKCEKTGECLTINPSAEHGDICPKLRGIIDLINADKEFPHFAVIVNNEIIIDDVLTGREYADRLTSRAAQLVLRVAILSEKCPLQDAPEEVDEEKDEA